VFTNLLALGRAWLQQGVLPPWLGLWWVYALAVVPAWWLYRRDNTVPGGAAS